MRAFGSELRSILSTALSNRFLALLAGIGVTALLQSSTATGLLMTSFAARGLVNLVPALAVALLLAEPCPGACLRQGCHRPRRAAAVATSEDGTPHGAETTMGCIAGNRLGASACRCVGAAVRNRQNQLRPPSPFPAQMPSIKCAAQLLSLRRLNCFGLDQLAAAHNCPIEPHRKVVAGHRSNRNCGELGVSYGSASTAQRCAFLATRTKHPNTQVGGTAKRRDSVRMFG